jgi:hypothetical protein
MKTTLTLGTAALALLVGCGPSEEERQQEAMEDAAQQMEEAAEAAEAGNTAEAMEQFGQAMEQMQGAQGDAADPVDFRRLKELLPEEAAGLRRTTHTGERSGAMGMTVSQAQAVYEGDDGAHVDVKILDLAGVPTFGMLGYAWTMAEVDRETETGYERTMNHRGHRGYEKYDSGGRSGQVQLIVAERFAVEVNGSNVDMDRLKSVVDALDLGALEGMRNEGR